jgi:hypothetical protein
LASGVGAAGGWVDAAGGGVVVAGSGRVARFLESGLMGVGPGFAASGPCGVNGFIDVVGFVAGCVAFVSRFAPVGLVGVNGFVDIVLVGAVCATAAAVASAMRTAAADPAMDDEDRRDMACSLDKWVGFIS